jgi:hypothetical protein
MSSKRKIVRSRGISRAQIRDRQSSISDERQQLQEILKSFASMLVMSGCGARELARDFATACRQLDAKRPPDSVSRTSKIDHAHIISHWYRDPAYLDPSGKPRKLALEGAEPSLTSLISRVLPGASVQSVLDSLLELEAVSQSNGSYEPTGVQVNFDGNASHWAYWNMKALHGVLQNMVHNSTCAPGELYLAKAAINPRFPVSELPGFHASISRRALRFLSDIDASMQRLEVSGSQAQKTEVGVLVLAFENPIRSRVGAFKTSGRASRKTSQISSRKSEKLK